MKSDTQVLIVGAGPTGLAAAAALTKLGITYRIIDKDLARSDKSKALGVQAGTLECLTRALGHEIVDEMIGAGRPVHEAFVHINDHPPVRLDLSVIPSRHNYILILAQSETERILEEYLTKNSRQVERQTELLSLIDKDSIIEATIRGPRGQDVVRADFVIGCDGAHSVVRHQMGFSFFGAAYEGHFILGDVTLKWPWPYESIQTFVSERGVIAAFPLKGEHKYRLILVPKNNPAPESGPEISLEEFRAIAATLSKNQITISDANWLTRFRVHHRMVEHFQKNRVFLAGDAAHIHSPAGGQGMNTGIQDALNLSFKLSRYFAGQIPFSDLAAYERERLPVARNVLRGTDFVFKMALMPENWLTATARRLVIPNVLRSKWIQRRVVGAMSEAAIAKREIAGYNLFIT